MSQPSTLPSSAFSEHQRETTHRIRLGDARKLDWIPDASIHLVVTSPPYLTPIFWNKITNASYEVENGSSFLGKPYEPNAIVKNDTEYILMLRKPGGYRQPTDDQRRRSKLSKEEFDEWFRTMWTRVPGASTNEHPAPFPVELAYRQTG